MVSDTPCLAAHSVQGWTERDSERIAHGRNIPRRRAARFEGQATPDMPIPDLADATDAFFMTGLPWGPLTAKRPGGLAKGIAAGETETVPAAWHAEG